MKKIQIAVVVIGCIIRVSAQQVITNSQYMLDRYSINPAVAGALNYDPLMFSYRQLWTGINGAPSFQFLSFHTLINNKMGLGGKIANYTTGPINKFGIEGTYSYHLPLNLTGMKLAFGLSVNLDQFRLKKSEITLEHPDDNAVLFSSENLIVPDAIIGTYLYCDKYYFGISIPQLFNRKVVMMNEKYLEQKQVRHYFINGGYIFNIKEKFSIEPSVLAKIIGAGIFQADINAKVTYNKIVWLGFSYRSSDAGVIMVGVTKNKLGFGYAYDITFSDIKRVSSGSHEFMFYYKFGSRKNNGAAPLPTQ